MGSLYLSLEPGFLCLTAYPDGRMPHLCFGIFPSQKSEGKDKTMMNMMTGAAEQVFLNTHITLRELKAMPTRLWQWIAVAITATTLPMAPTRSYRQDSVSFAAN